VGKLIRSAGPRPQAGSDRLHDEKPGIQAIATFVGEGEPAQVINFTTAATTVGPVKKMVIISSVTRELEEATPETASAVIARVLADGSNAAIDLAAFGTAAASAIRPAGLLSGVTPVAASTSTDPYSAIADDLGALVKAIGDAGIDPSDAIFVAEPREAMVIKLRGGEDLNVLTTLGLATPKSVAVFAPAGVYSGLNGAPTVQTSIETSIHWEDTFPAEIVSSPGVPAAPTKSAFQQELIVIKVRSWCTWAAAPGAVQVVNAVSWISSPFS
jgi:hypothetical protein